ncbi:MAG: HEPN domain-containing protein [Lachnospiraceae bacterium]|nr:HEPN domain-containing protein [Lachnospiraceae bacterium]
MQPDIKTLSQYRMNRAKEDLEAAAGNHEAGFYKAAINRSYYAIFHAIRAVNILDGFDASKHSSVIAHFNQYYIHEGKFDRNTYKLIDSAYRIREKCDYSDFFVASREDSENQITNARDFIVRIEKFLEL